MVKILANIVNNPQQSMQLVAVSCDVFRSSVKSIFKIYKMKIVHELVLDDPYRRFKFCEMSKRITANPFYSRYICFKWRKYFFSEKLIMKIVEGSIRK